MTAQPAPVPQWRNVDNTGAALVNGLLYSYVAGTTTPQATYTDSTQGVQNTNPVQLNSRGEASVWLDPTLVYKLVLTDLNGNVLWTQDQVPGGFLAIPFISATLSAITTQPLLFSLKQTAAEIAALVTPVNYTYAPLNVLRYVNNTNPGTTDMRPAVQAAYNVAMAMSPHGAIYIPAGTYLISSPGLSLTNQNSIRIYGDGPSLSVLVGDASNSYTILTISADTGAGTTGTNLDLANFAIKNGFSTAQHGLSIADYLDFNISNMLIQASGNPLKMAGMANGTVTNVSSLSWNTNAAGNSGLILTTDTAGIGCGPIVFNGCQFEGTNNCTVGAAINSVLSFGIVFNGCAIEANGSSLISVMEFANQDDVTLVNCYTESSANTANNNALLIRLGSTTAPKSFTMIGGHWFCSLGGFSCKYAIFGSKVQNMTVIGPVFANVNTAGMTYGTTASSAITVINTQCEGTGPPPVFDSGITGAPTGNKVQFFTNPVLFSGYGIPTNAGLVTNFPGSAATLAQCGQMISQLIGVLKGTGILGA